jgi:hypothetical protein
MLNWRYIYRPLGCTGIRKTTNLTYNFRFAEQESHVQGVNDVRWIGWHLPVVKAPRAAWWHWNCWPVRPLSRPYHSSQHSACRNFVLPHSSSPPHINVNRNVSVLVVEFLKICAWQLVLSPAFTWNSLHNVCYSAANLYRPKHIANKIHGLNSLFCK